MIRLVLFFALILLVICGVEPGKIDKSSLRDEKEKRSSNEVDVSQSISRLLKDLPPFPPPAPFEFYSTHKRVNILHIPKTAGSSFISEVDRSKIFKSGLPQTEFCYDLMLRKFGPLNASYIVAFYRAPRAHMYSQYLECKYDWWGEMKTNGTAFPRKYPNPVGFGKWIHWFYNSWNGQMSASTNITNDYYNCYHPYNMQTRFMSQNCRSPAYKYLGPLTNASLALAIERVNTLPFIGLTEYFDASMCLFWFYSRQHQVMKKNCQLKGEFLEIRKRQTHFSHGVPKHSEDDIKELLWKHVDQLTQMDTILYRFATIRFFHNLQFFESQTNISLQHLLPFNAQFILSHTRRVEQ